MPRRVKICRGGHLSRAFLQIGVTAFDAWNCRADVACVGADLRVRPQNRLRSGEDGRTHRSAPTVGASTPPSGSPEEKSTELPKQALRATNQEQKGYFSGFVQIQQNPIWFLQYLADFRIKRNPKRRFVVYLTLECTWICCFLPMKL